MFSKEFIESIYNICLKKADFNIKSFGYYCFQSNYFGRKLNMKKYTTSTYFSSK